MAAGELNGPYYVYLAPNSAPDGSGWVGRNGLRIGIVEIERPSKGFSRVSTRSEIPEELALGTYVATVCNEGCAKPLGDLAGSASFRIERTRLHGYIHGQMIEARTRILRRISIGEIRTKRRLRSRLNETSEAVLDQASSARFSQAEAVDDLQTTVDRVLDEQRRPPPFPWTLSGLAFGLGAAVVAGGAGYLRARAHKRWDRDLQQWTEIPSERVSVRNSNV